MMQRPIQQGMAMGVLTNPYMLRREDVGRLIDYGYLGRVRPNDVGKLVYLRDGIVQMENDSQRDRREANRVSASFGPPMEFNRCGEACGGH